MTWQLAPLWTDFMIWGLILSLGVWGFVISGSQQVKQQWLKVFESRLAMVSAIILMSYVSIALLDSVRFQSKNTLDATHFQSSQSLLDSALPHLSQNIERTYSAPFATYEYNKSLQVSETGDVAFVYLPLKHISTIENSVMSVSLQAVLIGLLLSVLLIMLHIYWRSRVNGVALKTWLHQILTNQTRLPWRTAYVTLIVLIILGTWFYWMSFYYHVLGTDKVGGDVLYESIKSIRTGVLIGVLTTLVMLPLALLLGISAGLFKGWVDDVIQYLYTTLNSIPSVLLIAAAVLVMQTIMNNNPNWFSSTEDRADIRLLFLVFILGMTSWTGLCRLLRAETLKISQVEFVVAARAFGVGKMRIIGRHIMPNVMHIVLIAVVLDFSGLVLAEAVLSYVGIGVDPTMHSWGNMINQARLEMARDPIVWWSLFSAFVFMFILVLAANLFSDRVQQVLDPRNHQ